MSGVLYLAWRYLSYHRAKTAILVVSIALIVFLPAGLESVVDQGSRELTARAEGTPLIVGEKGSQLELVLASLYFESRTPQATRYEQVSRIEATGLAEAIPLHVRFQTRQHPIVGTSLEYFRFRGLGVERGRPMATLGECVVGAGAARRLGVGPGDHLISSPESVFDLAGAYPLKMRVVGVLAPSHGPDDGAVFVDLKTTWVIEGFGHGHRDLAAPEADALILAREGAEITANASVTEFNEITESNAASFHFHGDLGSYPVTAVIAVPPDAKSLALLMGRYESPDETAQAVLPAQVMDDLLETVFTIQSYVVAAIGGVAIATLATAALVFWLSIRLRQREIETLVKIGAARGSLAALLVSEVVAVLLFGCMLAAGLTLVASRFASVAVRSLLLL